MGDGFKGCFVCNGEGYVMVVGSDGEPSGDACPLCIATHQLNKIKEHWETLRLCIQAEPEHEDEITAKFHAMDSLLGTSPKKCPECDGIGCVGDNCCATCEGSGEG